MRSIKVAFRIFAAVITCMAIEPAFAITSIRINSTGDSLGQGRLLVITDADNTIDATVDTDNSIRVTTSFENWNFEFGNAGDGPLLEGVYEEATRYPFNPASRPGLSASGNGRGCNTITGRFAVLEAQYAPGGEIVRFAADLDLSCGSSGGLFQANIRINSDLPLVLETPTASAGRDRIVFERDSVVLDATQSVGGNGDIATYLWTQTDGPTVNLSSASNSSPSFEAPDVAGAPVLLTFNVEVVNDNSLFDTDVMTVAVRDRSQPRSFLAYSSSPGDSIGRGAAAFLNEDDGIFAGNTIVDGNRVDLYFDGDDGWTVSMTAPEGETLAVSTEYFVTDGVSKPDLFVTHDGRGCSGRDGSFVVNSFTQGASFGDLASFSATFEHTCTNSFSPLSGQIYYQVVLPEANAGPDRTTLERVAVTLDPGSSVDANGSIEQYQWSQTGGPAVALDVAGDGSATLIYELGDTELEQSFEFQLLAIDELSQFDTDFVTVKVSQNNQAPVATDDMITVQQGFALDFEPLTNDTDIDGQIDASSLLIINAPDEGLLVNSTSGFTYIPPSLFTGITSATYVVYDNDEAESNTATITLDVKPGPLGYSDTVTTEAGVAVVIDVLANDQAADSPLDAATITIVQQPNRGTVSVTGNGSVTYTPSGNYAGQDFISYDVADGNGLRTPTTNVIITVTASASAPPATPPPPVTTTPAPVQAAASQPKVCSDVNVFSGDKTCGGGSLSPLSFLLLGLALVRVRRRAKATGPGS